MIFFYLYVVNVIIILFVDKGFLKIELYIWFVIIVVDLKLDCLFFIYYDFNISEFIYKRWFDGKIEIFSCWIVFIFDSEWGVDFGKLCWKVYFFRNFGYN